MVVAGEAWQALEDTVPFNRAYQALAVLGIYHATGGAGLFAAPVFVGALAALTLGKAGPPLSQQPGRNDPCPCGSGLKSKRCCRR
ncbi:MAG: SEC-C domain-containing protein [Deltaproteobacteria bacterium]|nr:SEC-C domain-containing protein [Deltaproteobacteria bacterium]